jgi:hypothetical protein
MNDVLIPRYMGSISTEGKNFNGEGGLEKFMRWQSGPPMLVGLGLLQKRRSESYGNGRRK